MLSGYARGSMPARAPERLRTAAGRAICAARGFVACGPQQSLGAVPVAGADRLRGYRARQADVAHGE